VKFDEPLVAIKDQEFLEQLIINDLMVKDSAPQNYFASWS
jgi:hypothetical protein